MMRIHAPAALLEQGWERDVAFDIDERGSIAQIHLDSRPAGGESTGGPVVCAMPNVHSHAFQRAFAGRTGRRAAGGHDSFWTWREAMYGFVARVDADAFEAIAAQAYVEMAKAGYGSVAEFHYVHHDERGQPYADPAELSMRVVNAAHTAGIGLTLLPVLYAHGGFGGSPPLAEQRRFIHTPATFAQLLHDLRGRAVAQGFVLGIAPHSLRAVTPEELQATLAMAEDTSPIHIHAAEQTREVDACVQWSGLRPVQWLLEHAGVDSRWCLVHATHMDDRETIALAQSGAVAGLAPSTEADLGDGTFPAEAYLQSRGTYAIGSDSNAMIDPFAELRQLEWSQRLESRRRNVLFGRSAMLGQGMWDAAARGGAQALAQPVGALVRGRRADLVVLNVEDAALACQSVETMLDAAIFGPCRAPVRHVMVAGQWIVREGRHRDEARVFARYRQALERVDAGG